MEWSDEGIIVATRRHGETSIIVELLTKHHGRHGGMVRGGRSKRYRPLLQLGNKVEANWRARLPEHLGHYNLDGLQFRAALIMEEPGRLLALQSTCVLIGLIAEHEPHERLYEATDLLIDCLAGGEHWQAMLVQWELGLLAELGFGLDLTSCAATGVRDNLIYVSPKSGRAVSAKAGEPYKDKLLALPSFLIGQNERSADEVDLQAGLRLTGYFLEKYLFAPTGDPLPNVRQMLVTHFE